MKVVNGRNEKRVEKFKKRVMSQEEVNILFNNVDPFLSYHFKPNI